MRHIKYILWALLPLSLHAQVLRLEPGVQVVAQGAPVLVLNNISLMHNGSFVPDSSTVLFTGDQASSIEGAQPVFFHNLSIGRVVQVYNSISVAGQISMDGGNLQLNTYTLDLGSTGSIMGERNGSSIQGKVTATAFLSAPQEVNPGNIGVAFTSPSNLGTTTITRGNVSLADGSIQRYFDISPENNTHLQASLRFYYLAEDLGGIAKKELNLFQQDGWVCLGRDAADDTAQWVMKNNIDRLQRFTLAKGPVEGSLVQIYPNPAHDVFSIRLYSPTDQAGTVCLYDGGGRLVGLKEIHCQVGSNTIQWRVTGLAAGMYYVVFKNLRLQSRAVLKE
jgi:hypothetical protein